MTKSARVVWSCSEVMGDGFIRLLLNMPHDDRVTQLLGEPIQGVQYQCEFLSLDQIGQRRGRCLVNAMDVGIGIAGSSVIVAPPIEREMNGRAIRVGRWITSLIESL